MGRNSRHYLSTLIIPFYNAIIGLIMIYKEYVKLTHCAVHRVGNRLMMDGVDLSDKLLDMDETLSSILMNYFISPFRSTEAYALTHSSDISLNEVYAYVREIFADQNMMYEGSANLANFLYEQSTHPNINGGEFYVAYFKDFIIDGVTTDAIGLFKTETKESYLKVYPKNGSYELVCDEGISLSKLDKGALIFNMMEESGYVVAVVDNVGRGKNAKYWTEDFLNVKLRKNDYSQTENLLAICKKFIVEDQEKKQKMDSALKMSKTINALQQPHVTIKELASEVFDSEEKAEQFMNYAKTYCEQHDIFLDEEFDTSIEVMKKIRLGNISKIRLDEHFTIEIKGGESFIEHGFDDEKKMAYYGAGGNVRG